MRIYKLSFIQISEVVLGYISNDARRFHTYVGNRVQHIHDRSKPEQWHHVSGKDNPADEASRGLTVQEILNNRKGFNGQPFLWERLVPAANVSHPIRLKEDDIEVRRNASSMASNVASSQAENPETNQTPCNLQMKYFERFSSWHKAKLWLVWIKKGIARIRQRRRYQYSNQTDRHERRPLQKETVEPVVASVEELTQSEIVILRSLQHCHFDSEVKVLQKLQGNKNRFERRQDARVRNHCIKQTSSLYRLDPFIDSVGLLRDIIAMKKLQAIVCRKSILFTYMYIYSTCSIQVAIFLILTYTIEWLSHKSVDFISFAQMV